MASATDGTKMAGSTRKQQHPRALLELASAAAAVTLSSKPVQPGALVAPISVTAKQLQALVISALGSLYVAADVAGPAQVIWSDHDSDVLVHVDQTAVVLQPGIVLVALTLQTDQTGVGQLIVPLLVGSAQFAAGLLVMTESRPRGPIALVDRWGDAAVAAAWRALIDASHALALHAGIDSSGARLVPGALSTDGKSFEVVPQARHAIDAVAGR
jgi:hypothetical protein